MASSVYLGGGGGGTPASPAESVQFNNAGAFGGNANLLYDTTTYTTPILQQNASALVVGNTAAGLGASPDPGAVAFGNISYADGVGAGDPPIQFEWNFTDGLLTGDAFESFLKFDPPGNMSVTGSAHQLTVRYDGTHNYTSTAYYPGAGALLARTQVDTSGTVNFVSALQPQVAVQNAATVTNAATIALADLGGIMSGSGNITNYFGLWQGDAGNTTASINTYYEWLDSTGVFRIKEDDTFDSVGQAIPTLYNPQFTKYTPGAANFERLILSQWNGNVAEVGTQSGGAGVLRKLRTNGSSFEVKPFLTGQPTTATTLAAGAAGAVTNGVHLVAVTYLAGSGETTISPIATITIASNDRINLSNIPTGNTFVTDRNIYISKAGETTLHLVTNIGDNTTTTFVFNAADATLVGAAPPGFNSTGLVQVSVAPTEIDLIGGSPSNGAGAPITITAGDGSGSNAGGSILLTAGGSGSGTVGDISLTTAGGFVKFASTLLAVGSQNIQTGVTTSNSLAFRAYDVDGTTYKTFMTLTSQNVPDLTIGPAAGATVTLQASTYKSSDGSTGATAGPFTTISSITVKNGLVTALTGS